MPTGEENTDRARDEAYTNDAEKHLHERLFDLGEYLNEHANPGNQHCQRNQNVHVEHVIPMRMQWTYTPQFQGGEQNAKENCR
jgi:hypothetical protein